MLGRVEKYLLEKIALEKTIHMTLIDPENITPDQAAAVAFDSKESGTAAIMIGGSTLDSQEHLDDVVQSIKKAVDIPTILFPGNVNGISRYSDAIWFMSLLNSLDSYFVIGAQIIGAPFVKKFNIEPISMGYIIVGPGGTAGIVGKAIGVPYNKPEIAISHALAAQYLGMHFVYLEGGSGIANPIPPEMIKAVKNSLSIPLVVGGGIRTKEQAYAAASAGADIIVTGNIIEKTDGKQRINEIIAGIKQNKP